MLIKMNNSNQLMWMRVMIERFFTSKVGGLNCFAFEQMQKLTMKLNSSRGN